MSTQVTECQENYWDSPPPDVYAGATVAVLTDGNNVPVCFWLGRRDGVAIQANEREQKKYTLDDPNGTIPYILSATKPSPTMPKYHRRFFKLEKPMMSLVDSFSWHYNHGKLNSRVKRTHFQLRGGGNMGDDEDDLLAALRVDDDEPDRSPAVAMPDQKKKDESSLPPHRRSSPPDRLRSPDEYLRFLKSGR